MRPREQKSEKIVENRIALGGVRWAFAVCGSLVNPLLPKSNFCTTIYFIVFKEQMLQADNNDLYNPLVFKAHSSVCQKSTISFSLTKIIQ